MEESASALKIYLQALKQPLQNVVHLYDSLKYFWNRDVNLFRQKIYTLMYLGQLHYLSEVPSEPASPFIDSLFC